MKKTTTTTKPSDEPKPIMLIVTIFPPKKGNRSIIVSGAPADEMPIVLYGQFADRHALLDQAFADVLKREPQTVTVKEDKKAKPAADDDDKEEQGDQLVSEETPVAMEADARPISDITEPESLPAIEGDAAAAETEDEVEDNG